jgi:hypothetical protein
MLRVPPFSASRSTRGERSALLGRPNSSFDGEEQLPTRRPRGWRSSFATDLEVSRCALPHRPLATGQAGLASPI